MGGSPGRADQVLCAPMRPFFSGRTVHKGLRTQPQEAFLEGHIAAFTEFGARHPLVGSSDSA